jgi:beta-lactamase class D
MNKFKPLLLILGILSILPKAYSQKEIAKDFSTHFKKHGVNGCFVLYDLNQDSYIKYNSARCDSGFIPASTFKIPHTVIALEEKVIRDENEVIKWNSKTWNYSEWDRDQTLQSAMKYSCIWVYFGFAEKIGIDKYYKYVNSFNYGNKDLTGPPTRFWLNGSFRISANQQIDFLNKFYHYNLPVSKRSIEITKKIIIHEATDNYKFSGKKGAGDYFNNESVMWFVGYLEKGDDVYFFALNFTTSDFDNTKDARIQIVKGILKELNLLN